MLTKIARDETTIQYERPVDQCYVCKDDIDCTAATDSTTVTTETSSECCNAKSQRRISFGPEIWEYEIPSREDMTEAEYNLSFYSPDEIAFLNEEQNETVDRMDSGKKPKKSSPYRGLEAWTQKGQHNMNQRIFACVDSVLDEQDKQWTDRRNSTRRIAKASKTLTRMSRDIAFKLAKQDEKEARKVYEEHSGENDEEENEPHVPLRAVIRQSTIMRSKKKRSGSGRSLDGSSHSMGLEISLHSHDSCDSGLWSLSSNSVFEKAEQTPQKKRKSKQKPAVREGKTPKETPAKTLASQRRRYKK
ncbi:MAG: hypothetical protein SGBAC_005035 [Bacillariaceae sp.]